jgi:hypothetical protein
VARGAVPLAKRVLLRPCPPFPCMAAPFSTCRISVAPGLVERPPQQAGGSPTPAQAGDAHDLLPEALSLTEALRTTGGVRDFTDQTVDDTVLARVLDTTRLGRAGSLAHRSAPLLRSTSSTAQSLARPKVLLGSPDGTFTEAEPGQRRPHARSREACT